MSTRIMAIDDDDAMQDLFKFVLADEGWDVVCFDYEHCDLQVVQQLAPDLIILDINLIQAGAGWSFLQLLKMEVATAAIPVVVCTTASELSLEIEGYLAARQISIVRKPFDVNTFIQTITNNLSHNPFLPILVVEDSEDLAEIVTAILELWGHKTVIASNGQLALDAIALAQYSLILSDISMPLMTGLEFVAIYAQQPGPHIPVILLSGQVDTIEEPLPEFVRHILPKPFEISRLAELVKLYAQPVSSGI